MSALTDADIGLMASTLSVYFNDCLDGKITREEYMRHSNEYLVAYMDFCDSQYSEQLQDDGK